MALRVVLATVGKFHTFDLARQMQQRGWLEAVFTGYPKFKLKDEGVPLNRIRSFPWLQTPYMARGRLKLNSAAFERELSWWSHEMVDAYAAARLPRCDIYMALSGVGLKSGTRAQQQGAIYICDRGSSHIRYQDQILREEYKRHHLPYQGVDPRRIVKEEAEYERADVITVASGFVYRSFVESGIPSHKLVRIPYGVNLARFQPTETPDPEQFNVLFVGGASIRKGIPYLLEGFTRLTHPRKQLTLVGTIKPEVQAMIARHSQTQSIECTGHVPQTQLKQIMSRSHVLVLPSIEEGMAMVMAQAMACGCPVIASVNTGGQDLIADGEEGFVVPIRDSNTIADRLQQLADDRALQRRMAAAALLRVQSFGGWDAYGQAMADLFIMLGTKKSQKS